MTEYIPVEKIINLNNTTNTVNEEQHISIAENNIENKEMVKVHCCRCRPDWFVKDGLGITCSGMTYGLILFAEFVVIGVILLPGFPLSVWSYVHALVFTTLAFLAASSHLRAMTTNPGTIPKGNFTDENVRNLGLKAGDVVVRCTRCECIKSDRAHHCSTCQRCIRKMDHHCPWINNCVGEFNQKFFVLFTFYIMLISGYAMALAVHYIFKCSDKDWKEGFLATFSKFKSKHKLQILDESCAYFAPATTIIFIVFLIFEGLLFGLFTLVMFCTQMSSVVNDETGIEQLKKQSVEKDGTWKDRMRHTFGGTFGVTWFSPFSSNAQARKRSEYSFFDV